jgi:glycosyltransferase involved in cell wall biosynthesis
MNGLVSIVVPIYNVEKYLRRCIESLLNQTYKHIEILLVNDESTDSSGEICESYAIKDDRIKVINRINGGLSEARNT